MLGGMQPPIFVRRPSDDEQQALEDGLRSADAFVLRRCQVILASARGERAPQIARTLGCGDQTVRDVINGFNAGGLAILGRGPSPPPPVPTPLEGGRAGAVGEVGRA